MSNIAGFLSAKSFAVAGASANRAKYGNKVFRALLASGRTVYPITPSSTVVEGRAAVASIDSLPEVPESLSIVTPPEATRKIVEQAIAVGVFNLWMQPGAEDAQSSQRARAAGLNVIDDGSCILVSLALERSSASGNKKTGAMMIHSDNWLGTRRQLLRGALGMTAGGTIFSRLRYAGAQSHEKQISVPTRVITRGPRHHWFGYYDKLQFDPTNRFVLGQQVKFEHRSPSPDDEIMIGMVDTHDHDRWIELGSSTAWCWQQGCMLQWLPGSSDTILWNDRENGRYVCRIMQVSTRSIRTIPHAIYAVSPDGRSAISTSFSRLGDVRPGYGYNGIPDPFANDLAPRETGIFHIDLISGASKLIIPVADIVRIGTIPQEKAGIKHYFNHLLFNQDGSRFIALHRWRYPDGTRLTRLITARPDGGDIRIVIPNGYASHFVWQDPAHIFAQSKEYLGNSNWSNFVFEDQEGGTVQEVGRDVLDGAGHGSFLPGGKWILNDTYPQGPKRLQIPHLFHLETGRRIDLGHFHSPALYTGEWRCDTHPRISPNGKFVCIDSPYNNAGRQLHLMDISGIVG